LLLTAVQLGLCALLAYPAYRLGGRDALQNMLLGAGLSWATVVASYIGLVTVFRKAKSIQMVVVVGGFLVRFAVLFGLLTLVSKTLPVNLNHLVLWLVSFYMVLVVVEAWRLSADMRAPRRRT
jgi:hypothetical protein